MDHNPAASTNYGLYLTSELKQNKKQNKKKSLVTLAKFLPDIVDRRHCINTI